MEEEVKRVSFVIPVLNSAATLGECLDAVLAQDFPRADYEIVVADAGSTDATVDIARAKGVDRIVANPLKTGEAGKAAGIEASEGELIALVDSDNILPGPGWLRAMLAPFDDPGIFASEPIEYSARETDPALTRYFAALGMNDPICLFVGNYDRVSAVTGKWTGLDVPHERVETPYGAYRKLDLAGRAMPTIGANGFVFRRRILDSVSWRPYFFDIDVAAEAVSRGAGAIAKVETGIIHLYCARLAAFAMKQRRRIRDFLFFAKAKSRTYPWQAQRKSGILLFCLSCATFLPLFVQACLVRKRAGVPWKVALLHIPVCYITLWVYAMGVLSRVFTKPQMADRSQWQK